MSEFKVRDKVIDVRTNFAGFVTGKTPKGHYRVLIGGKGGSTVLALPSMLKLAPKGTTLRPLGHRKKRPSLNAS